MVFEVLWSRQFVTVFGNSSYAVSAVLCAYMTGLGLGGLMGGKVADRITRRLIAFGAIEIAVAGWALAIPLLLPRLRILVPAMGALSSESLLVSTLTRFGLSFLVLVVPCFLMGMTLPLLVRGLAESDQSISRRIGALYCWNTLGAAFGCLAAGFWMLDTLGLQQTNLWAAGVTLFVGFAAFALSRPLSSVKEPMPASESRATNRPAKPEPNQQMHVPGLLLLGIAFVNGLGSLMCEVLWFRYLAFLILERAAYVFPTILCIYLLGLGLGGLIYSLLAGRIHSLTRALGVIELLLAISVLATFVTGACLFASGPPRPLDLNGIALITVSVPTVLMGMAFPLLCSLYGRHVQELGRRVGVLFAVNTAGTVLGSLLPIFVLVPLLGIQKSFFFASLLYGGAGLALLAHGRKADRRGMAWAAAAYAGAVLLFLTVLPSNLCQRVFLATSFNLARHTDILFYREGRTGTAILTSNRVDHCKAVYINGVAEVPLLYADQLCFKMLGDLGPMLHPHPDNVLMICFGGGIAAGATTCLPEVKSLTVVDLESSVVEGAGLLARENNNLLQNPKLHVVIDDGRNYIMTAHRRWPVIITDSTHPKTSDSWVLYTQEFYRQVRDHLTDDGVFVQWVPRHGLSIAEYKTILRTFESVFPHASLWVNEGMEEQGQFVTYTLLVATPQPLNIDVSQLQERLNAAPVRSDLEPYGLHTPAGFLDAYLCAEDTLQHWVGEGPVNTDDLPVTYYTTRYSKSGETSLPGFFVEPMEDIWPRLTNTGSAESAELLHQELALRAKAARLAFSGRLDEAYAVLPDDVRYQRMRRLSEDEPRYVDALRDLYWNNPQGLVFLAELRLSGPKGAQAIKPLYERVLELDPNNVAALTILGGMHSDAGEMTVAEDYLTRAVRLDPKSGPAQYNLALLFDRTGRHAEALQHYEKAAVVSNDPMCEDVWGVCLAQAGRNAEALQWFRRAVELQPTEIPPGLHLVYLLDQLGHTQEALTHARFLVKLDPENKTFLNLLAELEARSQIQSRP
ncbi:MAG TPA: fused MFS/spermidine synthase [Verrucomicrobiae bacterium]|nr:fused MFS/spermidine synthase [Verrucomicrobiae bacterium]